MSQRKKIVLHIGTHKTATTHIQSCFDRTRDDLLESGILYPSRGSKYGGHHPLAWSLIAEENRKKGLLEIKEWGELLDEIEQSSAHTAFVSSEDFEWMVEPSRLEALLDVFDVRVLLYMRHPYAYVESYYNQLVKDFDTAEIRPISQYVSEQKLLYVNYLKILDRWSAVFGAENMIARLFSTGGEKPLNVIDDVLDAVGVELSIGFAEPDNKLVGHKVALEPDALDFLRIRNRFPFEESSKQYELVLKLRDISKAMASKLRESRSGKLTLAEKQDVTLRFDKENTVMARKYLGLNENPFGIDSIKHDATIDTRPVTISKEKMAEIVSMIF